MRATDASQSLRIGPGDTNTTTLERAPATARAGVSVFARFGVLADQRAASQLPPSGGPS